MMSAMKKSRMGCGSGRVDGEEKLLFAFTAQSARASGPDKAFLIRQARAQGPTKEPPQPRVSSRIPTPLKFILR